MATVNKNTIKKWFHNFSKPVQEQFWAWMDSYWHKDEMIPADKVEGLNELFEGLEFPDVSHKLDVDGANLDDENKELLRVKLGVGEVPENVGLLDTEDSEGNTYSKTQVDALIPTPSNLAVANQIIPEDAIREIVVNGRLDIKNLQEKETDDNEFSKKLVTNTNGSLAIKEDVPNLNVTFPSSITVNHNYMRIQTMDESWQEEILNQVRNIKNGVYSDYDIKGKTETWTVNNVGTNAARVVNGSIICSYDRAFNSIDSRDEKAYVKLALPTSGDYVISADCVKGGGLRSNASISIIDNENLPIISIEGESQNFKMNNTNGTQYINSVDGRYNFYIIKTGSNITLCVISKTKQMAGLNVANTNQSGEFFKLKINYITNNDYLELSNFKIKRI